MLNAADKATLKQLGAAIKARRIERGLTQPQLSVATECSIGFVGRLEAGKGGRLDLIVQVLRHLKMEMSLRASET